MSSLLALVKEALAPVVSGATCWASLVVRWLALVWVAVRGLLLDWMGDPLAAIVFEREAEADFVLELHDIEVTGVPLCSVVAGACVGSFAEGEAVTGIHSAAVCLGAHNWLSV